MSEEGSQSPFLWSPSLYEVIAELRASAMSRTHQPMEGVPIGQHPLVKQILKGVYSTRPPQLQYVCTCVLM